VDQRKSGAKSLPYLALVAVLVRDDAFMAAAEPNRIDAQARLDNLASSPVWADDDLYEGERVRWGRANAGYRKGAEFIARRGAALCLSPGCKTAVLGRRLWCGAHEQRLLSDRESGERAMRTVLSAAWHALDLT